MKKSNACVLTGSCTLTSANEYKLGFRGWMTVGSQKVRFDLRKADKSGKSWAGYDAAVEAVKSADGKQVQVLGHMEDGSWVNAAGDIVTGNRFTLEKIRAGRDDAERISFRFNAIRRGKELYYAKPVGKGCLRYWATVSNLEDIPEGKLVLVTMVKTVGEDDFGFRMTNTKVTAIEDAYTGDEYGVFTKADVAAFDKLRVDYEKNLRARAKSAAAAKK